MWEPEKLVGWLHRPQSPLMQVMPGMSEAPAESQERGCGVLEVCG